MISGYMKDKYLDRKDKYLDRRDKCPDRKIKIAIDMRDISGYTW